MNLQPMTMDRTEARKAFLEYRDSVKELVNRETDIKYDEIARDRVHRQREIDEGLMAGYRLLALGRQIISLRQVIAAGGEDDRRRPKLAIARADHEQVQMRRNLNGSVAFGPWIDRRYRTARTQPRIELPAGTLPVFARPSNWASHQSDFTASAMVPLIPPRFRPRQTERYHVLFEAEWTPVAPRDPALLRALGGGLYAVVAVWALTDLERAVLELRR